MAAAEVVNTKEVTGRRKLRFNSLDEIVADAERMASGPYRQLGNWSLGKICMHLARGIDSAVDGSVPPAPWLLRKIVGPMMKGSILKKGMTPGFKLPKKAATVLIPDSADDAAGLDDLRRAVKQYKAEGPLHPHSFFGSLKRDEWDQLHMRHAELHLSFLVPA